MKNLDIQEEVVNLFYGTGFKLTGDQKKQLLKVLPEFKDYFTEIEKICETYLIFRVLHGERHSKADFLQSMNGKKNELGYIGKLKKSLEANLSLMKKMAGPDNSLNTYVPHSLWDATEATVEELRSAIVKAEKEVEEYVTNRSVQSIPPVYLVGELVALYFKVIGREPARKNPTPNNPSCPSEKSPIADIIKILDPRLKCGPCTGHIRDIIYARKENHPPPFS